MGHVFLNDIFDPIFDPENLDFEIILTAGKDSLYDKPHSAKENLEKYGVYESERLVQFYCISWGIYP